MSSSESMSISSSNPMGELTDSYSPSWSDMNLLYELFMAPTKDLHLPGPSLSSLNSEVSSSYA